MRKSVGRGARPSLLLLAICIFLVHDSDQQQQQQFDCQQAPSNDFRHICSHLQQWDRDARRLIQVQREEENSVAAPGVPGEPWLAPAVPAQFNPTAEGCMNIACLCTFFRGAQMRANGCVLPNGFVLGMAVRKEYRQMTDNERARYHSALQRLKASGHYDRLSVMHRDVGSASGAHSGPGFLPWHREYLKRMEVAVRLLDPGLALPYWDSVIDSYLPDPKDSILFTPEFMGGVNAEGMVVNGPFANFRTIEGRAHIWRNMGHEGRLFSEQQLNNLYSQTNVENVLAHTAPNTGCPIRPYFGAMEYIHSSIHLWVGGDMKPPSSSANDPIFFLHHGFVDYVWEQWRQMRQDRYTRERTYPRDIPQCENPQHFSYAQMRPWDKQNIDGLSNEYTDYMFRYAPRPSCSHARPFCSSPYLFCDARSAIPHCVAKVRMSGNCQGFEGLDACHNGVCIAGFCRPGTFSGPQDPTVAAATTAVAVSQQRLPAPITTTTTQRPLMTTTTRRTTTTSTTAQPPRSLFQSFRNNNNIRRAPLARTALRRLPAPPFRRRSLPQPSLISKPSSPISKPSSPISKSPSSSQKSSGVVKRRPPPFIRRTSGTTTTAATTTTTAATTPAGRSHRNFGTTSANPAAATSALTFATSQCYNDDPCCEAWSAQGECQTNHVYMDRYCRRSCSLCQDSQRGRGGCYDRHVSCAYWRTQNYCTRRRQWMAENCQASCGWCAVPKRTLCSAVARMSRMA